MTGPMTTPTGPDDDRLRAAIARLETPLDRCVCGHSPASHRNWGTSWCEAIRCQCNLFRPAPQQPPAQEREDQDQRMLEALNRGMPAGLASRAIYGDNPPGTPPSEADSAGEDAHEAAVAMIRTWIDRHPRHPLDPTWSDWAARNFLADPEVRAHVALAATSGVRGGDDQARERLADVLAPAIASYVEAFMSCADSVAEVRQIDYRYMADDFLESCEIPQLLLDAVRAAGGGQ